MSLVYFVCIFSCEECVRFFKHAILKGRRPSFKCREDSKCTVDKLQEKTCLCCRYQKCLTMGMKPEGNEDDLRQPVLKLSYIIPPPSPFHPYMKMLWIR